MSLTSDSTQNPDWLLVTQPKNSQVVEVSAEAAQCMKNLDIVSSPPNILRTLAIINTGHWAPYGGLCSHEGAYARVAPSMSYFVQTAMGGIRKNLDEGGVGSREKSDTAVGRPSSRMSGASLKAARIAG